MVLPDCLSASTTSHQQGKEVTFLFLCLCLSVAGGKVTFFVFLSLSDNPSFSISQCLFVKYVLTSGFCLHIFTTSAGCTRSFLTFWNWFLTIIQKTMKDHQYWRLSQLAAQLLKRKCCMFLTWHFVLLWCFKDLNSSYVRHLDIEHLNEKITNGSLIRYWIFICHLLTGQAKLNPSSCKKTDLKSLHISLTDVSHLCLLKVSIWVD